MDHLAHLHAIVREEMAACPETETLTNDALKTLEDWLVSDHSDFCKEVRLQIKNLTDRKLRRELLSALNRIYERIVDETRRNVADTIKARRSAGEMHTETLRCFELIHKLGRGFVGLGSARLGEGERWYVLARELVAEFCRMTGATAWSGGGPGFMRAILEGGRDAGVNIGAIKIILNGNQSAFEQKVCDVVPPENVVLCNYFGPRKIGLVDAGVRNEESDTTAFVAFPGGFGTEDELFEVAVLKQLKKLGSRHPVPIIRMNYDNYYTGSIAQTEHAISMNTITREEAALIKVCQTNEEALEYLADFYAIPADKRAYRGRLVDPNTLPPQLPMDPLKTRKPERVTK